MKMMKIKMLESVVGDRISIVKGATVSVNEELAKDLIMAKHAVAIGKTAKEAPGKKTAKEAPEKTEQAESKEK